MIRSGFRIVIAGLAIVGLATILFWFWRYTRSGEDKPEVVTFTASPNGSYKAALATWAGGGGISPYCYNRLTVVPAGASPDESIARDRVVFEAECDSFAAPNGKIGNSPAVRWESDQKLKVTFSILGSALHPAAVKLRKQDASGRIAIDFEVQR
jgi:hypothetical protein